MIPIGILTRNRAVYLDATLRSLSVTELPQGVAVIVYDDASDDPVSRQYLDTSARIATAHRWPDCEAWHKAGLGFLLDDPVISGIAGRVLVVSLAETPLGVVTASCRAILDLFERAPATPAVILLQDDVVLKDDWYARLTSRLGRVHRRGYLQGLVAGMHLDHRDERAVPWNGTRAVQFISAQCWLITRAVVEDDACLAWFNASEHGRKNFDRDFCRVLGSRRLEMQLLCPYVCQHIGVASQVRPDVRYYANERSLGRIGRHVRPPFAWSESVRQFSTEVADAA